MMITHSQCPRCAKEGRDLHQDNLALFPDGHSFCFACRYYIPAPDSIENMSKKLYKHKVSTNPNKTIDLEQEVTYNIPNVCHEWLRKYNVTTDDILKHGICWHPEKCLLILPVYDGDQLVAYSGRYFGSNKEHPKYITWKAKTNFWKLFVAPVPTNIFVLVEDFISALRVGHNYNSIPLLGTNVPIELLMQLVPQKPLLITWLDRDKATEAMGITQRASQFFPSRTLITPEDPKCYTNNEIKEFINVFIYSNPEVLAQP